MEVASLLKEDILKANGTNNVNYNKVSERKFEAGRIIKAPDLQVQSADGDLL